MNSIKTFARNADDIKILLKANVVNVYDPPTGLAIGNK